MPILCYLGLLPLCALLLAGFSDNAPGAASLPRQNLSRCTPAQWTATFSTLSTLPLGQRIACWADLAAVESSYVADPLGEGPLHPPDTDPLSDFARVDCVTFLEQVYALALSPNYAAFPETLQKIRYRDGKIDFRWRNHYFVSDWLPANQWCMRDVTDEVGGDRVQTMAKTIARGKFFKEKGLQQYAALTDEDATTRYIPRDKVKDVVGKMQTGDAIIFVIENPGIIAGHTGLIRVQKDTVFLQHASLTAKTVVTVPLHDYLRTAPTRFLGFKIARPYEPVVEKK